MRKVSAMIQVHSHNGISRITDCKLYGKIGLCTGMRLYIRIIASKQFLGTLDCKVLNHIYTLASTVVTLSRIAFGIFVC